MRVTNQEQPFHPIYNYAFVTDRIEGLIVTDVKTFADGDLDNNFLSRGADLEPGRHPARRPPHYDRRALRLRRGRSRSRRRRPRRADGTGSRRRAARGRPRVGAAVPLPVRDGRRRPEASSTSPSPRRRVLIEDAVCRCDDAQRIYVARTYAYVAAGAEGLAIVDVWQAAAEARAILQCRRQDSRHADVVVATTNASLFAYVADGSSRLKVMQLTSPESQPNFYGFSPEPRPELIATYTTSSAGVVAVERTRPRSRRRRDRRADRSVRAQGFAATEPRGNAAPVSR